MLSYLHGYHAGNAADVLKHSVLAFCLTYLKKKEAPLLCVDTHAGAGFYDLSDGAASQNMEWEKGIGLLNPAGERLLSVTGGTPSMISDYLKLAIDFSAHRQRYSGSPAIMAKLLEKGDRLVCFELHPGEFQTLKTSMTELREKFLQGPSIEVRQTDGPAGLKSLLPPPSRRGLVLIDPSWEVQSEFESIPRLSGEGFRRFPEGTFIIWYPLLAVPKKKFTASAPVQDILFGLKDRKCCRAELCTGTAEASPRGMYGSGLVIYNPPWTLKPALEEVLPFLAKLLGDNDGNWRIEWCE